ncbi:hypothetical protein Tc00.1047053508677.60 [Trypanosoma cruzi]|uniref:Secreted protein n=1 Tax=Trypanosoma cruzi (strain CL Brener) TaxID=353153 RepID=Q4DEF4_TRYCC|nr:hypothetical protein Tc00.1047053508677.60 [Trypanosoma cruzi]EAN90902.1 hypothetical protein Tc00.1047053508677.60 [Trypanosoma cruzi]|eukprot:XP_812753.1 hypothetical protein [Trypanosoma cruzi strain CL Brener]
MAVTVDECFWLHFCALLWVIPAWCACGPKTKLFEGSPVGTMAAACGCHSVLSGIMLRRFHVCVASGTMCRRLCNCRVEGEERKELRERRGQESCWVSRRGGPCPPNPAPPLSGTLSLSHCRIVTDATSTQRCSGCRTATSATGMGHVCCCVPRGHTEWHSGVPTNSSRTPHMTPGTGRGVSSSWRTPWWSSSSFHVDGRLFLLLFLPIR